MGITNLLKILDGAIIKNPVSKYKNTTVGIDGHSWIHQILPAISYEMWYGKPTKRHITLFLEKIAQLQKYKIKPIFVFDGDYLESKAETGKKRRLLREKYKKEVKECLERGEKGRARELMKRVIEIKPVMIYQILKALENEGVEYIISPYEADAQLCHLQKSKYIDYILTEDSDLIVFGADNILYKYDGFSAQEFQKSLLPSVKDEFFAENILEICILSGCDYIDSIKGVGLLTAHKKLKETKTINDFVEHYKKMNKPVPENYLEEVAKAKIAFLFHIVYDPNTKSRRYLNKTEDNFEFLGTLENIPYKIEEDLHIDRHFKPQPKLNQKTILSIDIKLNPIEEEKNKEDSSFEVEFLSSAL